jgi:hypothetical protein
MYFSKLSIFLVLSLILLSYSNNKSSNSSQTTGSGYRGGEIVDGYTPSSNAS